MCEKKEVYAGFWIRFLADFIDSTLLTLLSWIAELAILGAIYWGEILLKHAPSGVAPYSFSDAFNPFLLQLVNVGIYAALALPYYVWGHYRYGTTLGKRPLRIYVVSQKGHEQISLKQSIARCLGYVLSYLLFCTGFLMAMFHPEKRGLHDLIAGTVSIRKPKKVET